MSDKFVFAIDCEGDALSSGFIGEDGAPREWASFSVDDLVAGESAPVDRLFARIEKKLQAFEGRVAAISVATSSDLSWDCRTIVNSSSMPWLNGVQLADIMEKTFGLPVFMERRAVSMLRRDRDAFGLPEDSLVVGCYIGDVYENAIWAQGDILRGKHGVAGNIGHMPIHGREDNCRCGKVGCIELYGSGRRLRHLHSMVFPDAPLEELFVKHGEHPLLVDYISTMAYPVAMEINLLDPDYVILGGWIPRMKAFPIEELEASIREQVYHPYPGDDVTFLRSSAESTTGVVAVGLDALGKVVRPGNTGVL